jgi:hypothetical protein
VRGSVVTSSKYVRPAGVALLFHVAEDRGPGILANEARDVLNKGPTRSKLADDPEHLEPEAGPVGGFVGGADSLHVPRDGNLRAREASGNDGGWLKVMSSAILYFRELAHARPAEAQDIQAVTVALHLPQGPEANCLQAIVNHP